MSMSGPIIDMTPEGEFRPPPTGSPLATQVLRIAIMVAVVGGALALAAFALWIALLLIPVVLGAAAVGWIAWRWRIWQIQSRYSAASDTPVPRPRASATRV